MGTGRKHRADGRGLLHRRWRGVRKARHVGLSRVVINVGPGLKPQAVWPIPVAHGDVDAPVGIRVEQRHTAPVLRRVGEAEVARNL